MLDGCSKLKEVRLNLPNVIDASYILYGCSKLKEVRLNLPNATDANSMLYGCSRLKEVRLDLPNVVYASYMLYGCSELTEVSLDLPNVTDANSMLANCIWLKEVRLDLPNAVDASYILYGCSELKEVSLDLPNAVYASYMLAGCSELKKVSLDLPNAVYISYMLNGCTGLEEVRLDGVKVNAVNIDGITTILKSSKKVGGFTIHKAEYYPKKEDCFVAERYGVYAHGKNIKDAVSDCNFKFIQKNLNVDDLVKDIKERGTFTKQDYRLITGACNAGVDKFCEENNISSEKLAIKEVLRLTADSYGGDKIRELFIKDIK